MEDDRPKVRGEEEKERIYVDSKGTGARLPQNDEGNAGAMQDPRSAQNGMRGTLNSKCPNPSSTAVANGNQGMRWNRYPRLKTEIEEEKGNHQTTKAS